MKQKIISSSIPLAPVPESRKEHIVMCASKLFLKQGYVRTSIRDVARECNIAMGTLYHYIGTKENLLRMVVEYHVHLNNMIIEKIETSVRSTNPMEALLSAVRILLEGIEKYKKTFVFVFTEAKSMPMDIRGMLLDTEVRINAVFEKILISGKEDNIFQLNDTALTAHHIVSIVEMWGVKWWYLNKMVKLKEYNDALNDFVRRAVSRVAVELPVSRRGEKRATIKPAVK